MYVTIQIFNMYAMDPNLVIIFVKAIWQLINAMMDTNLEKIKRVT